MNNRPEQAPSNGHEHWTADSLQYVTARAAAASVLDAFYLQGRVMAEAEYAPYRDAMRALQRLATHAAPERRRHQTALILPMRRQADKNAHISRFARRPSQPSLQLLEVASRQPNAA